MTGDVVYYQCQIWFRQTVTRKCLWQFKVLQNLLLKLFGLFHFFPPVSHSAKHYLRSSKIQITAEGSIVFYSLHWHWEPVSYMGCSLCQPAPSSVIAGQLISSGVAGLKEHENPAFPISASKLQSYIVREGFQHVSALVLTISLIHQSRRLGFNCHYPFSGSLLTPNLSTRSHRSFYIQYFSFNRLAVLYPSVSFPLHKFCHTSLIQLRFPHIPSSPSKRLQALSTPPQLSSYRVGEGKRSWPNPSQPMPGSAFCRLDDDHELAPMWDRA